MVSVKSGGVAWAFTSASNNEALFRLPGGVIIREVPVESGLSLQSSSKEATLPWVSEGNSQSSDETLLPLSDKVVSMEQ